MLVCVAKESCLLLARLSHAQCCFWMSLVLPSFQVSYLLTGLSTNAL